MEQLVKRLTEEHSNKAHNLSYVHAFVWSHDSEIICCQKGVCVFVQSNANKETMYTELEGLLRREGVV